MDGVKRFLPSEQKIFGLWNRQILRHPRNASRSSYFEVGFRSRSYQTMPYFDNINDMFRRRTLLPTHQFHQRHHLSTVALDLAKKSKKSKAGSSSKSKSKEVASKPKSPPSQQVVARQVLSNSSVKRRQRNSSSSNTQSGLIRESGKHMQTKSSSTKSLHAPSSLTSSRSPSRSASAAERMISAINGLPEDDPKTETSPAPATDLVKSPIRVTPQHRLRRNASQFIPMWLRREPSWRIAVHEHLKLPLQESNQSQDWSRRIHLGATIQGNFYEETIPSFSDVLRGGPPEALNDALDVLVKHGLGDTQVAERYRTTCRIRLQNKDWVAACSEKKQQVQYHRQVVQDLVSSIIELQERLTALEHPESSPSLREADGSMDAPSASGVSTKANLEASEEETIVEGLNTAAKENAGPSFEPDPTDPAAAQRSQQVANLHKIISEKVQSMKQHQRSLDNVLANLNQLRQEHADAPMDDEEFQAISDAAEVAKPVVTKVFAEHVRDLHSQMLERYHILDSKTDLTKPQDWYLHARLSQRKIIFHGGPTNSGKTYQALQRLKQAKKGMYVGPLRLLAAEIYERLTAEGIYCNLFTGQEVRDVPFSTHKSATVEMTTTTEEYDVVVIDEIQMISDSERGFAWTRALLGVRCSEIHVCGGLEAVDVVKRLVDACGDEFELREYQRFSELQIASQSLARHPDEFGCYKNIQSGDCVVAFSRNDIFAIKREIETSTKHKCCVIYGSLPPSTRSEQARRFNDPDSKYDVLVASDAIGMGLNLNIRRIIFNSVFKNNGSRIVRLDHSSMKQISGRAGRRNSPFPNGIVTTRDPRDMDYLRQCLSTEIEPIQKAGLLPTATHIETFSDALEKLGMRHGTQNLHRMLQQFNDMASVKSEFFVCMQDPMVNIAKAISSVDLDIPDKFLLCQCPVTDKNQTSMDVLKRFATKKAAGQHSGLTKNMIPKAAKSFEDLARLCGIFSELELFLWLQRKFPPGNMMEQQAANVLRERAIQLISTGLSNADKLKLTHCYIKRDRGLRNTWNAEQQSESGFEDEEEFNSWNDENVALN